MKLDIEGHEATVLKSAKEFFDKVPDVILFESNRDLIHSELLILKLPALFVTPRLERHTDWADDLNPATALASPVNISA